jgi:hypothetical protein
MTGDNSEEQRRVNQNDARRKKDSPGPSERLRGTGAIAFRRYQLAARVLAAAAYLHNVFSVSTVFTTVIIFAGHLTTAARMLAFPVFVSHACILP